MSQRACLFSGIIFLLALLDLSCRPSRTSGLLEAVEDDHYAYEGVGLTPQQERGRRIWYEACGDNGRFHAYSTSAKFGAPEDWYKVLGSPNRDQRWPKWGLIPDPDCKPGNSSTYGFDICKGDLSDDGTLAPAGQGYQGLLSFVGKPGYKDPGCWISGEYREQDCALGLGTSTGAMGYRKFPNPRFDPKEWPGWENFDPLDGAIEPPFLIGTSCGSCHITFNPNDPPQDPNHPKMRNIKGLVGNQFQHVEEVIASGADPHTLEYQAYLTARAGAVDTSAVPNDLVHNPGTVNSLINLDKRPPGLPPFAGDDFKSFDRVIADENGKTSTQRVFGILKGGEDDVGGAGAILRVYINIGTCAESCWMNHLLDNRAVAGRGSQQTPFSQAQCRRECPAYAALEEHYGDVMDFFLSKAGRPTDLKDALFPQDPPASRYEKLVQQLGQEKVSRGRHVFADNCAKCHSSQKPPQGQNIEEFFKDLATAADETGQDPFLAEDINGVRNDWLGNEEKTPQPVVGTFRCRALHSNHLAGQVWDEFSSETYKNSPTPEGIPELKGQKGGGRGYYRNVSLLSVWSQAPLLHNNAVGPEICNKTRQRADPCIDKDAVPLANGTKVSLTSIEGRLKVFEDSMHALLNPASRGKKATLTDDDLIIPIGLQVGVNKKEVHLVPMLGRLELLLHLFGVPPSVTSSLKGAKLVIPKGTPVALLASLDYRKLIKGLAADVAQTPSKDRVKTLLALLQSVMGDPAKLGEFLAAGPKSGDPSRYNGYSNCTDVIEDKGHEFGASLSAADKDSLIAFMKTL